MNAPPHTHTHLTLSTLSCLPACLSACQVCAGDSTLSLLPPWHIYQRSVAYYLFSRYVGV